MNICFTIEEENIVAIYAEDSRETTLENIPCRHALHGRGYTPACRRSGEQAASHDGQRVFRKEVYLDRRGIAHRKQGRGCRLPAPRPCFFLPLRGQLESRFCGFEYKVSSTLFPRAGSRRNTGVFSP